MTGEEYLDQLSELLSKDRDSLEHRLSRITEALSDAIDNGASREYVRALEETQSRLSEAMALYVELYGRGVRELREIAGDRTLDTEEKKLMEELTNALVDLTRKEADLQYSLDHSTSASSGFVQTNLDKVRDEIDQLFTDAQDAAQRLTNNPNSDLAQAVSRMQELYETEDKRAAIALRINQYDRDRVNNEKELLELRKRNAAIMEEGTRRWAAIKDIINGVKFQVKDAADMWFKYNAQAISDSKRLGITSIDGARAYTQNLMENSKQLARNFGMSAEQAMKMQETYTKVTGRATLLTRSQMEDIAASSKLMGEETVSSAIKILDDMGTTSQTATELMDRNYARAANSGLDTVKASEEFVKNLSLANKFSFRNGVDGISRMTILSQRIRMNFQEVASVADKFSSIEGALQASAQLQMLGGAGAMYGGNPMQMMYEALSDPEALFERMGRMFSEQATFDRRTGEARISPLQLQIMREQARAMGMNPDEAVQSAKQQAKNRDIEAQWRLANPSVFSMATEEERSRILNTAQFNRQTGGWEVSYLDETGEQRKTDVRNLTAGEMAEIMKDQIDPVQDIRGRVREIAMTLVGTKERLESMRDQWRTGKAQAINGGMELLDSGLTAINGSNIWGEIIKGGALTIGGMLAMGGIRGLTNLLAGKAIGRAGRRFISLLGIRGGRTQVPSPGPPLPEGPQGPGPKPTGSPQSQSNPSPGNGAGSSGGGGRGINYGRRALAGARSGVRGAFRGTLGRLGAAASVAYGAYSAYSGWQEADAEYGMSTEASNRLYGSGRISNRERDQRILMAQNRRTRERSEAVGGGIGAAAGGLLGIAAGAATTGALIGTGVGGPLGTAAGFIVGGAVGLLGAALGKNIGGEVGKALEDHEADDTVGRELAKINDSDEEENLRRIVLPIESIDYNVALIANQLGITSAMPARGNVFLEAEANGEMQVEGVPLQAGYVSPVESGMSGGYGMSPNAGTLNLNISGRIELTGIGTGSLSANDIKNLIDNNPSLQRQIVETITGRMSRNGTGGRNNMENADPRRGTVGGYNSGGN